MYDDSPFGCFGWNTEESREYELSPSLFFCLSLLAWLWDDTDQPSELNSDSLCMMSLTNFLGVWLSLELKKDDESLRLTVWVPSALTIQLSWSSSLEAAPQE